MSRHHATKGLHRTTLHLGQSELRTRYGVFDVHFFRDLARDKTAMAIVHGDLTGAAPLLARVHSSCLTSECLGGRDCDCAEQLDGALMTVAGAGDGVVFYLMQEGRGAGLTAKARDRMIVQASGNQKTTFEAYSEMGLPADLRNYESVAPIGKMLGIRAPLCLLTNNPDKAAAVAKALSDEGIEVCRTQPVQGPTSEFNRDYLSAKYESGHALNRPVATLGALPPSPVPILPPVVVSGEPNRIRTAAYYLPIALSNGSNGSNGSNEPDDPIEEVVVDWFRLSVVFDCETARESIVLALPGEDTSSGRPDAQRDSEIRMSLFDRLPAVDAPGRAALMQALLVIRERGHGSVAVHFDDRDRGER